MFLDQLRDFFFSVYRSFATMRARDVLDILIVAYLVYIAIRFIRNTRAGQLARGVIVILVLMQLSDILDLNAISFILKNTVQLGVLALLIVFQPELRSGLEKMGRNQFKPLNILFGESSSAANEMYNMTEAMQSAIYKMARGRTGALIVFERSTKLGDIIDTGTVIDAKPSSEMIQSIFFHNSPLHDGALVVRDARLYAAGCFLPLTHNLDLDTELGTRHRAALGMSEVSDALVIVVSEETGRVSVAINGNIKRGVDAEALRGILNEYLFSQIDEKTDKKRKRRRSEVKKPG